MRIGTPPRAQTILFAARLAGAGLGFLTQLLLARLVVPDQLGAYFFAVGAATVAGVICALGYPSIAPRIRARGVGRGGERRYGLFVRRALREALLVSLALGGIGAAALLLIGSNDLRAIALLIALAAVPALAIGRSLAAIANAERRFLFAYLPEVLGRPAAFLAVIAALAWAGVSLGAEILVLLYLICSCAVAATLAWPARRHLRPRPGAPKGDGRRLAGKWRKMALPVIPVALVTSVFADLSIVSAGLFLPAIKLAVLAIAVKIALLVGFAVQISQQTALPDLAEALRAGDRRGFAAAMGRARRFPAAVTIAATVLFAAGGDSLLALFGPHYVPGHWPLVILAAGQAGRAIIGPTVQVAVLSGETRLLNQVFALGGAFLLALMAVLCPLLGVTGAAIAISATVIFWPGALLAGLSGRLGARGARASAAH